MSLFNHFWRIELRLNPFKKDKQEYVAEVISKMPTRRIPDIARRIEAEGCEFKYESLLNIIGLYEETIAEEIEEGNCVMTPNCRMAPRITGVWDNLRCLFDPKIHIRTLDITPTAAMRKRLEHVGVDILGEKRDCNRITNVTDESVGLADHYITPDEYIRIDGINVRILSGEKEEGGVCFIHDDGTETRVTRRLITNQPSYLIAYVPEGLPEGSYLLKIKTCYTGKGGRPTKECRSVIYQHPLIVGKRPAKDGQQSE